MSRKHQICLIIPENLWEQVKHHARMQGYDGSRWICKVLEQHIATLPTETDKLVEQILAEYPEHEWEMVRPNQHDLGGEG